MVASTNEDPASPTTGPGQSGAPASQAGNVHSAAPTTDERKEKLSKKWMSRLKLVLCCVGYKENKDSFHDVAKLFAQFDSTHNVLSTKSVAALRLLATHQEAQRRWEAKQPGARRQYLSGIQIDESTEFLDMSSAKDSRLIHELIYYMEYSLATFGLSLQVINDPCTLCCIYPHLRLSSCCTRWRKKARGSGKGPKEKYSESGRPDNESQTGTTTEKQQSNKQQQSSDEQNRRSNGGQAENGATKSNGESSHRRTTSSSQVDYDACDTPIVLSDTCCWCHTAAAKRRLGKRNYETIYISFESSVGVSPFLVAADHSKRTIVVAIRGSACFADMVTDFNATVDRVPIDGCPEDWLCHRGFLKSAQNVKSRLHERRVLERAFNCRPELGSQDYGLVLCGHSLGASTAAILGLLLRAQFPALKAYLFSPSGGVLSMPAVEHTKEFATGIILGYDAVARVGIAQFERLRYHGLSSLEAARRSRESTAPRAGRACCCASTKDVEADEYDPEQMVDFLHATSGPPLVYKDKNIPFQVDPQVLYVPGRLIHVVRNDNRPLDHTRPRTRNSRRKAFYQAVWTDNAVYDRILVSDGAFRDHLPWRVMRAVKTLCSTTTTTTLDNRNSRQELRKD